MSTLREEKEAEVGSEWMKCEISRRCEVGQMSRTSEMVALHLAN